MRTDIDNAITLLKRGDPGAVEKALELLQRSVFAFGMRVCGQREDAEDTMQEVLMQAVPYLPKFENSKALATWLYKVAKTRCLMSRRRSKFAPKQELSLEELMPDRAELGRLGESTEIDPEKAAMGSEQGGRVREAVRKLPPHYRIVMVLRDMEGFTDDEVGEITGLRPATVRVRLHRARLFVRKELAKLNARQKSTARPVRSAVVARTVRCRKMFAGLSDYLDGELDEFSCEGIEAHLNGCEPCKKFLRSLEQSIEQCRQSPAESPSPAQTAEMRKQLIATFGRALATEK